MVLVYVNYYVRKNNACHHKSLLAWVCFLLVYSGPSVPRGGLVLDRNAEERRQLSASLRLAAAPPLSKDDARAGTCVGSCDGRACAIDAHGCHSTHLVVDKTSISRPALRGEPFRAQCGGWPSLVSQFQEGGAAVRWL